MLKASILSVLVIIFTLIFCGCTTVKYNGPTYAPTDNVEVFYSKDWIKKPYDIMGKVTVSTWYSYDNSSLRPALIEKAKASGADAVLIHSIAERIGKTARVSDNEIDEAVQVQDDEGVAAAEDKMSTLGEKEQTTEAVDQSKITAYFLKYKVKQ